MSESDSHIEIAQIQEKRKRHAEAQAKYMQRKKAKQGMFHKYIRMYADLIDPIGKVYDIWQKLHDMHPSKPQGTEIIKFLMRSENLEKYVEPETLALRFPPTEAEIFEDLDGHTRFFNHLSGDHDDGLNWKDFLMGWGAMRNFGDPTLENHTPLVAFDVVGYSDLGLSRCIVNLPLELEKENVHVRQDEEGKPYLVSVITPAGSITSPHCDNTGSGHVILGSYGTKLVVWWDTSDILLKNFGDIHCCKKGEVTVGAVKTWPGLHWTILQTGKYLIMEPGQVHAVVSPENSAVSGWSFISLEWLKSGVIERMMGWELRIIESRLERIYSETKERKSLFADPFEKGGPVDGLEMDIDLIQK